MSDGYRRDKFSPFRKHLLYIKQRAEKKDLECNVDLKFLYFLWRVQGGVGYFSDVKLTNPPTSDWDGYEYDPYRASIDRIDQDKGYIQTNIRFVSYIANIARNLFSDEVFIKFCNKVSDTHTFNN